MTYNNHISELVGNTPILKLNNYVTKNQLKANIFAKLEYFNPAGSVKDRIAKAMLFKAKEDGILKPDSVIIEPTSGNTGIGLASLGTSLGHQVILTTFPGPPPDNGAGNRAHPGDGASANGGGQGGGKCCKLADIPAGIRIPCHGKPDACKGLPLNEPCTDREIEMCSKQKSNHGNSPKVCIDGLHNGAEQFHVKIPRFLKQ